VTTLAGNYGNFHLIGVVYLPQAMAIALKAQGGEAYESGATSLGRLALDSFHHA
jgi:hypothetical protein